MLLAKDPARVKGGKWSAVLGADEPSRWICERNPEQDQSLKGSTPTTGLTLQNADKVEDIFTFVLFKNRRGVNWMEIKNKF